MSLPFAACGDDDAPPPDTGTPRDMRTAVDERVAMDAARDRGTDVRLDLGAPDRSIDVAPDAPEPVLCFETCDFSNDGECDDGGEGSITDFCEFGTDCIDCGPREGSPPRCDPGDAPSCDGNSVLECQLLDGEPTRVTTPCESGERCDGGRCVDDTGECSPDRCEGNVAVSCDLVGGSPSESRMDCGSRTCMGGRCVAGMPDSVTITASFGDVDPIFAGDVSVLSIQGVPAFAPALDTLPNLFGRAPSRVIEPDPDGCDARYSPTLNRSQVALMIEGSGVACRGLVTGISLRGVTLEFDGVPLQSGGGTIDVRLEMTP